MTRQNLALAKLVSGTIATVLTAWAGATTAVAAPNAPANLSPEQKSALQSLDTGVLVVRKATASAETAQGVSGNAVRGARLSLYRGSFLMWARDTMTWYYTGSRMSGSYLSQEAGYVFPNVSEAKGTTRYYASTWTHAHSGRYRIGAGVVTPWGAVTVYSLDYSTDWHVYANGAGTGRWNS